MGDVAQLSRRADAAVQNLTDGVVCLSALARYARCGPAGDPRRKPPAGGELAGLGLRCSAGADVRR